MARILVVTPPGSMARVIWDLRGRIFSQWGAVSALALPPLIPLGAWPEDTRPTEDAAMLAARARAGDFRLVGYRRHSGYHYLEVACAILDHLSSVPRGGKQRATDTAPVPPYPGFLLAGPDLDTAPEELEQVLGVPAERRFRSYGLSIIAIHSSSPPERWWDLVSWEEVVHVPVKSSGRAAPGSAARAAGREDASPG